MNDLNFLIILPYFERPQMVQHALASIKNQTYPNWHVAFIDDNSPTPGRLIAESILQDYLDKVTFYRIDYNKISDKIYSTKALGYYANNAIKNFENFLSNGNRICSCENIALILCDDDLLFPDYLENLNCFYFDNPKCLFSSCLVKKIYPEEVPTYDFTKPTKPSADQSIHGAPITSYRLRVFNRAKFDNSATINLDKVYFNVDVSFPGTFKENHIWGQLVSHWSGSLSNANPSHLKRSLTRSELKRLHGGKKKNKNMAKVQIQNEFPRDFEWKNSVG